MLNIIAIEPLDSVCLYSGVGRFGPIQSLVVANFLRIKLVFRSFPPPGLKELDVIVCDVRHVTGVRRWKVARVCLPNDNVAARAAIVCQRPRPIVPWRLYGTPATPTWSMVSHSRILRR